MLIIQSSSPLPPTDDAPVPWWKRALSPIPGKLIQNLQRLPSYLFERSQQTDRLSTLDLFVVSMSPDRDAPDWPPLFDFRRATVNRAILRTLEHRRDVDVARLASHAAAANEGESAFRFSVDAGRRASNLGSHRESTHHYRTALRFASGARPTSGPRFSRRSPRNAW